MTWLVLAGLIALQVNPMVCQAPCTVTLVLRVEPAKDNEKVVLEVEGELYSRTTYIDFSNGGPKTQQISYKGLPGGDYTIRASLHKHDAKSWVADSATVKITVTGE